MGSSTISIRDRSDQNHNQVFFFLGRLEPFPYMISAEAGCF